MTAFGWALLAALCWGFAPLLEKAGLRDLRDPSFGVVIRSIGVLTGLVLLVPFFSNLSGRFSDVSSRTWIYLMLGGFLASIAGQACFYRALKLGDVSRVVPVGASYPVIACLLGILLLREPLTPPKTLGIVFVVAGTYLLR